MHNYYFIVFLYFGAYEDRVYVILTLRTTEKRCLPALIRQTTDTI